MQVGSIVGLVASPWHGVYSSSKAAVHNLTDAPRLELAPFGIQVGGRRGRNSWGGGQHGLRFLL